MKRIWTIIGVNDVRASCKWYQSLFGQPQTAPAHDEFGQLLDSDGTVLLCLHQWGAHEHPSLMVLTARHQETGSSCSFASTILTWHCKGLAGSFLGSKRSLI